MHTTIIPARYYADACIFASTEQTRYYLNGAALQPGGYAVATDGHRLFVSHAEESDIPLPVILRTDKALIKACTAKSYRDLWLVLRHEAEHGKATAYVIAASTLNEARDPAALAKPDFMGLADLIDGTFPDWRRIIPVPPAQPIPFNHAFNGAYVADFTKASGSKSKAVHILPCSVDGPALIGIGRRDAFGVLMPMRSVAPSLPAWVDEANAQPKPAEAA